MNCAAEFFERPGGSQRMWSLRSRSNESGLPMFLAFGLKGYMALGQEKNIQNTLLVKDVKRKIDQNLNPRVPNT